MSHITVRVRMWTKEGYHKDVLVLDEQQTRMFCEPVHESMDGVVIDPKDFPEAIYFTIVVERE